MKDEIRVGVRSGAGAERQEGQFRQVKVAIVSGGRRPMLWLGDGTEYGGIAWVTGAATLRRIRDALTEVLDATSGEKT